jgi:hypothetical protein
MAANSNSQPDSGQQVSVVHGSSSEHEIGVPAHPVAPHTSSFVQASPSVQSPACGVNMQPSAGSHVSVVHASSSSHSSPSK